jgi:hypothetical protein
MHTFSDRPLIALGPDALGKAAHRHFPQPFFVYYESIKRELKRKLIYENRCDGRPKTKNEESTLLSDTGLVVELEHLKTKTRLKDEKFESVKGECETFYFLKKSLPKPTRKVEALVRSPSTIVSRREEDAVLKEVVLSRYRYANLRNDILETKAKDGAP